jgi:putative transcriptional regulator
MAIVRRSLNEIRAAHASSGRPLPDFRSDEAIARAVAEDPDAAPLRDSLAGAVTMLPALTGDEIRALREANGLSQPAFAEVLHISVHTLRNWEQKRTRPDPIANTLFHLIRADPATLTRLRALTPAD